MTRVLSLLRHGDTAANGRLIGATDLPVAESGYAQLARTRANLQTKGVDRILYSPMLRCRQSVDFLQLNVESAIHPDLREIDFGVWEGRTFTEIVEGWPAEVQDWSNWSEEFTFPAGENIGCFLQRVKRVREAVEQCQAEHLLLVSHGGMIKHLLCLYLGISSDKYLLFDIKPGHLTTLSLHSDGGVLTSLNCG